MAIAGAVLGEEPRRGFADAARGRGTGDDCDFVLQQHGGLQRGLNVGRMLRLQLDCQQASRPQAALN